MEKDVRRKINDISRGSSKTVKMSLFIVVVFLSLLLIISIVGIVLLYIQVVNQKREVSGEKRFREYQYLQYNSRTQEKNLGVVSLPNEIKSKDYITYRDSNENRILITNFGEQLYECMIYCYCLDDLEEEETERRGFSVLSSPTDLIIRVAMLAVVSITIWQNYEKSERWVKEECGYILEDDCDRSAGDHDECWPVPREWYEKDQWEDRHEWVTYFCKGNCLSNIGLETLEARDLAREYRCDMHSMDKILKLDCFEQSEKDCHTMARERFQDEYLIRFCKNRHFYTLRESRMTWRTVHICVEKNKDLDTGKFRLNPTIICHKTRGKALDDLFAEDYIV